MGSDKDEGMQQVMMRESVNTTERPTQSKARGGSSPTPLEMIEGLKDRLKEKRDALGLSQLDVARQIIFWNNKQHEHKVLSRSAYCMYESGEVVPDLSKIVLLATVLKCDPQWLAFGIGEQSTDMPGMIEEVDYIADGEVWIALKPWTFDEDWIVSRFEVTPEALALYTVNDFSTNLKPGDVAVVRRGSEPGSSHAEYVYAQNGIASVASITRPHRNGPYRVYSADRKKFDEVDPGELHFLGKVVGKVSDL